MRRLRPYNQPGRCAAQYAALFSLARGLRPLPLASLRVLPAVQSLGYRQPNMRFVEGQIEYLDKAGIPDESIDLVISNCVVSRVL